jgi:hypothetical protein
VAENGRSQEQIRRDISTEREQLAGALTDLRRGVRSSARRIPVLAGGALALAAVVAAAKRWRGDD